MFSERGENGDDPQAQNEEAQQQDSDYEEGVIEVEVNEEEDDNKDFKMAKAHGKADAVSGKENGRFHPSTSFRSCTQRDTGIGNNSAAAGGEAMHANQFTLQVSNQQETEPFGTGFALTNDKFSKNITNF
jgi:hypothetical protein